MLGANRMNEVHCKNSITRHQKGSQREKCEGDWCDEELDPEEMRLIGATSLFLWEGTCAKGGGGGIPMPAETKYKRIVCPVNKGPNHKAQPA